MPVIIEQRDLIDVAVGVCIFSTALLLVGWLFSRTACPPGCSCCYHPESDTKTFDQLKKLMARSKKEEFVPTVVDDTASEDSSESEDEPLLSLSEVRKRGPVGKDASRIEPFLQSHSDLQL